MKQFLCSLLAAGALPLAVTTAWGAQAVANPTTGDNSVVGLALIIMGIAAVVMVLVLFFTRKKK